MNRGRPKFEPIRRRDYQYRLWLTQKEGKKLHELSIKYDMSMADILRKGLQTLIAKDEENDDI